eukprot:3924300-Rhodomonas_salina.4
MSQHTCRTLGPTYPTNWTAGCCATLFTTLPACDDARELCEGAWRVRYVSSDENRVRSKGEHGCFVTRAAGRAVRSITK